MKNKDFKQLNIIYTERDKVWSLCPMHKDINRPNLSISLLDKYYGKWHCWACGRNGCLTKQQMRELNLGEPTIYKNDKSTNTRWNQFNKSCYDNLQKFPLLKLGLAKQLGVSIKSLDDWLVGYDGQSFTVPMYREDLADHDRDCGLCGVQRRFSDDTKRCVKGSHLGWLYSQENIFVDDTIFICEGFSDGISVYDLGFNVMSRPHCWYTDGIDYYFEEILGGIDMVIVIPDNDTVGLAGAKELQDAICCSCIIHSFDGAKDIREQIKLMGRDYVKWSLGRYM